MFGWNGTEVMTQHQAGASLTLASVSPFADTGTTLLSDIEKVTSWDPAGLAPSCVLSVSHGRTRRNDLGVKRVGAPTPRCDPVSPEWLREDYLTPWEVPQGKDLANLSSHPCTLMVPQLTFREGIDEFASWTSFSRDPLKMDQQKK
jgi:hypothetical protein